jgi:hypothetical protein
MGFPRVHTLAGEFSNRTFYMPPEFEDAERGLWEVIFAGEPVGVKKLAETNLELVTSL